MDTAEERAQPAPGRPRYWLLGAAYLATGIIWIAATKLILPLVVRNQADLARWTFLSLVAWFLLGAAMLAWAWWAYVRRQAQARQAAADDTSALTLTSIKKAVEAMQLGLTIADAGGQIIYSNPSEARMHGYDQSELPGKGVQVFAPDDHRHRLTFDDLKRMKRWRRESINVRKDGSTFPVQLLSDTVLDSTGQPMAVITTSEDISERRRMERVLRESEERYRSVVENAYELIACLGLEGRITFVNKAWTEVMGYTHEESTRLDFFSLVDEDSKLACHQALAKVLAGTNWNNLQATLLTSDGKQIPAEGNLTAQHRDGKVVGAMAIFRDITYRKQVDSILRRNEKQFRLLIKNALDIIMILNRDGTIRYTSSSAEAIFGFKPEELLAKPLFDFVHRDDLAPFQEKLQQMQHQELPTAVLEFRGRHRDGGWRIIEAMANNLLEEPSIEGIVVNARDVTDRRESQERLANSEERFRYLANSAADAIATIDQEGAIIFWNKAAETIFGYTGDEALKEHIDLIIPKRFLSRTQNNLSQLFAKTATGSPGRPMELVGRKRGGIEFPVELSFSTWNTREGSFLTAIIRDISERKEAERQLKYLSFHDPLTGLYNRAYFEEEMQRMEKSRFKSMGLVLGDVDGLKLINDTMGHKTGDGLLVVMAGIIKDNCRIGDMVARIGGDEFAVLLPNCERDVIEGICTRIKETTALYSEKNPELPLSLSLGHSVRKMEEISVNEVYREADNNMYREKVKNHDILVKGFIQALERKNLLDPQQVATLEELMLDLAGLAGIPHHRLSEISLLARYHDIGMALLAGEAQAGGGAKPGEEEAEVLKRHTEIGYHIAMSTPYLSSVADWILKHEESWNGKGYPLGLKGEDIPLESRILAIAKVYVELTSPRGQEPGLSPEQALMQIRKEIGKQFDPRLADLFLRMMEKRLAAAN